MIRRFAVLLDQERIYKDDKAQGVVYLLAGETLVTNGSVSSTKTDFASGAAWASRSLRSLFTLGEEDKK